MTPEELARVLNVEPGELKWSGEQALPHDDSARGYAMEPLRRIAERLAYEGDVIEVLPSTGAIVRHLQWAVGVYFLAFSMEQRVEIVRGTRLDVGSGDLLVDGREAPAVVRISSSGTWDRALVLGEGKAELWQLTNDNAADRSAVTIVVPELYVLTQGVAGSSDIEREYEHLRQSTDVLDRIAAPGLLLRYWVPADREIRRKQLLALAFEDGPILVAVRSWCSTLSTPIRNTVSELAVTAAHGLAETFAKLAVAFDHTEMYEIASQAALRREQLESVRRVIVAWNDASEINVAVHAVDKLAASHLTQLADARVDDPRLRRVLVSEPDAWWGAISD